MYLTLWRSSTFSWYQLMEQAGSEIILHVNRAEWPSIASVEIGLMTNLKCWEVGMAEHRRIALPRCRLCYLGAAHFLSMSTSWMRYFSICSLRRELNSERRPSGSLKSFQLAYF